MTPNPKRRPAAQSKPPLQPDQRVRNVPDYSDRLADEALRRTGDQGYADLNAAMERKTKPQAEDLPGAPPPSATTRGGQRDDDVLRRTGNFDATTGEVGPDVDTTHRDELDETEVDEP